MPQEGHVDVVSQTDAEVHVCEYNPFLWLKQQDNGRLMSVYRKTHNGGPDTQG